jgi:organic hydroperoxide reductase OsmC/OhrA
MEAARGVERLAGRGALRADDLKALLKPFPAERMRACPYSNAVQGNVDVKLTIVSA